jgi:polyisoprenoid-binding protein YceI
MKPLVKKLIIGVAVLAIGAVAGPWVYINLIKEDAPEALKLEPSAATTIVEETVETTVQASAVDGQWAIATDSIVGYRVKEVIVAQSTEGVGRTSAVKGTLNIAGEQVTEAQFSVDMTTLKSDSSRRDKQVNTRILDTATYPTATFTLKQPIKLTPEALAGSDLTTQATGTLTLRGVTKDIELTLIARLANDVIEVNGSIEIIFADWSIPDPSISAIVVEDRGQLEFLLRFTR